MSEDRLNWKKSVLRSLNEYKTVLIYKSQTTKGVDDIVKLISESTSSDPTPMLDTAWINSLNQEAPKHAKYVRYAIKIAIDAAPSCMTEYTVKRLHNALENVLSELNKTPTLSNKQINTFNQIYDRLLDYKGNDLNILADRLSIESSLQNKANTKDISSFKKMISLSLKQELTRSGIDISQINSIPSIDFDLICDRTKLEKRIHAALNTSIEQLEKNDLEVKITNLGPDFS